MINNANTNRSVHGYKNITEYLELINILGNVRESESIYIDYQGRIITSEKAYKHEHGKSCIRNLDIKAKPIANEYFNIPRELKAYINDDYHIYNETEYDDTHCIWHQKPYEIWHSKGTGSYSGTTSKEGNIEFFKYKAIKYAKYSKQRMLNLIEEAKLSCDIEEYVEGDFSAISW